MDTIAKTKTPRSPLVSSIKVLDHTYERSYVDCGRANCTRCRTPAGRYASHGPYWYLCYSIHGKWRRVYLGKNLDTSRFCQPDGRLDFHAINSRPHLSSTAPGPQNDSPVKVVIPKDLPHGPTGEAAIARSIARVRRAERRAEAKDRQIKLMKKASGRSRRKRLANKSSPP
jgi:hypothetical protein